MRGSLALAAAAAFALASFPPPAAAVLATGASVRMRVADDDTWAPQANLRVRNRGTSMISGAGVSVFAENERGAPLWTGTVDVPPRRTAALSVRIPLEQDATTLVAVLDPPPSDTRPEDDVSRVAMRLRGRAARAVVGRSVHLAWCASCHGDGAAGGTGPSIVGASAGDVLRAAAGGGDHAFPWLSRTDARALAAFLSDPAGVDLPPPLPDPPPGGWPGYAADVLPAFETYCLSCHGGPAPTAPVRLDTYDSAAARAEQERNRVVSGSMPKGQPLSSSERQALVTLLDDWITGGLRE